MGLCFSRICGRLGPSRSPLATISEPSWGVWRRLGAVLARLRGGLGPSLGRLGASWGRLGGVLGASWGILEAFRDNFHAEPRFLIGFCSQLRSPKPKKSLIFHWFYMHFFKNLFWKLTSIGFPILVPNWLDLGVILAVLGDSGGILGRLGRVLAPLGGLLGRLWPVMCATWRVLAHLGAYSARLGTSWVRLGAFWLAKPPQDKPDLTWNGKRRSF